MPAAQNGIQPFVGALLEHRLAAVGFRCAYQLLQGFLAQLHLLLQQGQIVLQRGDITVLLAQFGKQHAHGRQRRTQLVSGAGSLGGHGQQLLVAHAQFAPFGLQLLLPTQFRRHAGDEEGDQRGSQGEAQPHAIDKQILALPGGHLQRMEPHQQQGVGRQGEAGEDDGVDPRQGRRGDGQRHQVIGNEGVARTAGEVQQGAMDDQVEAQLDGELLVGDRPGSAQAHGGQQDQRGGNAQGDAQGQPGQRQQIGEPGETDRSGLRAENQDTDEDEPAEILTAGRRLEDRCTHSDFRNLREYSQGHPPPDAAKRHSLTYPA
ncbi:hypothetical protein D3C81_885990 [compost metagenome]